MITQCEIYYFHFIDLILHLYDGVCR
jgi:hypothetical protein